MDIIQEWPEIDSQKKWEENVKRMNAALRFAAELALRKGDRRKFTVLLLLTAPDIIK